MLLTILTIFHVLIAFVLIGLILVQRGKGADAGAAFGSGGSSTIFGARGSTSFLSRTTAILAIMFFSNIMALGYLTTTVSERKSLMEQSLFEVQDMKWQERAEKTDGEGAKAKQTQDDGKSETPPNVSVSAGSDEPPEPKPPSQAVPESQSGASTAEEAVKPAKTQPADMPEMPK
ncbi:MAG: preprotein translocase subunit SecG [Gammaproteobacteria bacterium]